MSLEGLTSETVATNEQSGPRGGTESTQCTSPTNSDLPSSPPVARQQDNRDAMSPPGRKRSRDEDQNDHTNVENSAIATDGDEMSASQVKPSSSQVEASTVSLSSIAAKVMAPPPLPVSTIPPRNSEAPTSGQGTSKVQSQRPQPPIQQAKGQSQQSQLPAPEKLRETPAASLHKRVDSEDTIPDESDTESEEPPTPSEPQIKINEFDWNDLEQRYHIKIKELDDKEHSIYGEFDALCTYFSVWANTSQTHEVDRSYKRLKTQATYVQHEEHELEKKRSHYIKVVEAFKSALQLLGT